MDQNRLPKSFQVYLSKYSQQQNQFSPSPTPNLDTSQLSSNRFLLKSSYKLPQQFVIVPQKNYKDDFKFYQAQTEKKESQKRRLKQLKNMQFCNEFQKRRKSIEKKPRLYEQQYQTEYNQCSDYYNQEREKQSKRMQNVWRCGQMSSYYESKNSPNKFKAIKGNQRQWYKRCDRFFL